MTWRHEGPFMSEAGRLRWESIHFKHAAILWLHCQWQPRSSSESSETFHPITKLHIHVLDLKTSHVPLIFQSFWTATSCYPKVIYMQSCLYTFVWCGDMKRPVHPWLNSLAVFHLKYQLWCQWLVNLYPFACSWETKTYALITIKKIILTMIRAIIWISDGLHKKLWLRS